MFKKGVIFVSLFCLLLGYTFIAPFSIMAQGSPLSAPFVGINFNIIDYDKEQIISSSTTTGTFTTQGTSGNAISMGQGTLSNGQTYYSTGLAGGSMAIKGTISINNNSSYSFSYTRIIECNVILDNNYIGSINLQLTNGNYNHTENIYVNGTVATCTFVDTSSNQTGNYSVNISYSLIQNNNTERWDFPIESLNAVTFCLLLNYPFKNLYYYNTYKYPLFEIDTNKRLFEIWGSPNQEFIIIGGFQIPNGINNHDDYLIFENCTVLNRQVINYMYGISVVKYHIKSNTSNWVRFLAKQKFNYMPIYYNTYDFNLLSTDFALSYGLTNSFLDNISIIANGNNQSNQSVSNSDTTNQLASDTFDTEEQLISNAETDLNNNLNTLDIANQNNNLFGNSKFIASASWVKTQFDNLTNNNAFGYMITFSLVIGIALVIIGKLRG